MLFKNSSNHCGGGGDGYFESSNIIDDSNCIDSNTNIVANKRVGPIQRPTNAQRQHQQKLANSDLFGFSNNLLRYSPQPPDDQLLNNLHIWNQQLAEAASRSSKTPTTNSNTFNLLTNSFTYSQPSQNTSFDVWNNNNPMNAHNGLYSPSNNGQTSWPNFHVDYLTNLIQTGEPQGPEQAPLTTDNLSYLWFTPSNDTNQFDTNAFDYHTSSSTLPWNSVLLNNLNDCLTISDDGNNIIDNSRATLESLWLNNEPEPDDDYKKRTS